MKNIIFTFVLCLLIQGCASTLTFKFDPQVLNGQEQISQEGAKTVISQKKARVAIRPLTDTYSSEDRPTFVVSVYGSEEPFNFSTEDIRVFVDGNRHRVFTYDELVADIKEEERTSIEKAEVLKSSQYMTGGGQQSTIELDAKIYSIQKKTKKSLEDLDSTMLKKATVFPNNWHSGHVIIEKIPDPAQPHKIKVIVTAAGEEHEFLFNHFMVQ
jgi:archaellum component FlaG (FlaF/FlaG flagellin family)